MLVSGEPVQSRLTDIGYVPQDEIVHRGLTVVEGLRYAAWLRLPGDSTREDIDDAVDRVLEELDLAPHADTRIGSLSGGQRKRVGVGTELVNRPSLLFLDEPTTGLDPHAIRAFWDTLALLRERGVTMVISSHILAELQHRVDRLAVMVNGRIEALGTVQQLREQKNLPLQVTVTLPAEDLEAAAGALRRVQVAWADLDWHAEPHGLLVRCPRAAKVSVLQAMAALGGVLDIQVVEPTLEDLFFSPASREADS